MNLATTIDESVCDTGEKYCRASDVLDELKCDGFEMDRFGGCKYHKGLGCTKSWKEKLKQKEERWTNSK